MTSSDRSNSARLSEGDTCPECLVKNPGDRPGELVSRPARPYPIVTQLLFGVSFVLFLIFFDQLRMTVGARGWVWAWTGVQAGLGALLVYQRVRARRRILHCIRCGLNLR